MVLGVYFAQARMYDAADRRFMAADPIKGAVSIVPTLVKYQYALNNSLRFIDPLGLAGQNPIELLNDTSNFSDVARSPHYRNYYHVRGVMEVLGGTTTYYDIINTTALNLAYNGITVSVVYCMDNVPRSSFISGVVTFSTSHSYSSEVEGKLPILYNSQKTYVNLKVLRSYFMKIWCEEVDKEKDDKKDDDKKEVSGRTIIPPNVITGTVNNVPKNLTPAKNWYAYQGDKAVTDGQGRYRILVGPKVIDANYPDKGKVSGTDFKYPIRINVVLENEATSDLKTIECIVEASAKAHTYNKYPDGHPDDKKVSATGNFKIENGLFQTGIAYPNSWNAKYETPFALDNIDASSIEFLGRGLDFRPDDYRLVKIIVLD
jgi:RHS repeat-associated protein